MSATTIPVNIDISQAQQALGTLSGAAAQTGDAVSNMLGSETVGREISRVGSNVSSLSSAITSFGSGAISTGAKIGAAMAGVIGTFGAAAVAIGAVSTALGVTAIVLDKFRQWERDLHSARSANETFAASMKAVITLEREMADAIADTSDARYRLMNLTQKGVGRDQDIAMLGTSQRIRIENAEIDKRLSGALQQVDNETQRRLTLSSQGYNADGSSRGFFGDGMWESERKIADERIVKEAEVQKERLKSIAAAQKRENETTLETEKTDSESAKRKAKIWQDFYATTDSLAEESRKKQMGLETQLINTYDLNTRTVIKNQIDAEDQLLKLQKERALRLAEMRTSLESEVAIKKVELDYDTKINDATEKTARFSAQIREMLDKSSFATGKIQENLKAAQSLELSQASRAAGTSREQLIRRRELSASQSTSLSDIAAEEAQFAARSRTMDVIERRRGADELAIRRQTVEARLRIEQDYLDKIQYAQIQEQDALTKIESEAEAERQKIRSSRTIGMTAEQEAVIENQLLAVDRRVAEKTNQIMSGERSSESLARQQRLATEEVERASSVFSARQLSRYNTPLAGAIESGQSMYQRLFSNISRVGMISPETKELQGLAKILDKIEKNTHSMTNFESGMVD